MKVCFIAQRMMRYELKEGGKCGLNDAVKVPTYRVAGCVGEVFVGPSD